MAHFHHFCKSCSDEMPDTDLHALLTLHCFLQGIQRPRGRNLKMPEGSVHDAAGGIKTLTLYCSYNFQDSPRIARKFNLGFQSAQPKVGHTLQSACISRD